MTTSQSQLKTAYDSVRENCKQNWRSVSTRDAILRLSRISLRFLISQCAIVDLISKVAGKNYAAYSWNNVITRPINRQFFLPDEDQIVDLWRAWIADDISPVDFARMSYTVALAPCLAMELFDRGNRKGPATFFECYIGHIFASAYEVNPVKSASLQVSGQSVRMTMDFLFEVQNQKLHLPVKMSTRERVVQAWAHQRLLDSAFGENTYKGIMVLFAETKLDSRSREVVEIFVPSQWLAYQTLLSRMERIYYFDVPERYQNLTDSFPDVIQIKQFGEFFTEKDSFATH